MVGDADGGDGLIGLPLGMNTVDGGKGADFIVGGCLFPNSVEKLLLDRVPIR